MSPTYLLYQLTLVPFIVLFVWLTKNKVLKQEPLFLKYTIVVVLFLAIWGEVAVWLKQWYYPQDAIIGLYVGNIPIEAYIEALITPIFIISFWEFIKRHH